MRHHRNLTCLSFDYWKTQEFENFTQLCFSLSLFKHETAFILVNRLNKTTRDVGRTRDKL